MKKKPRQKARYDVFVSYSHRNGDWVKEKLLPRLKRARLNLCVDEESFKPGEYLVVEMERAVQESKKTVLVLTPDYLNSKWTGFENVLAQTIDPRRVIPLLLEPCDVPLRLRSLVYIDCTQADQQGAAMKKLIAAIRSRSASFRAPQASPAISSRAIKNYRQWLVPTLRHLPLRGIDISAGDPQAGAKRLELARVYINLDTKASEQEEEPGKKRGRMVLPPDERMGKSPLSALKATIDHRRLVILGDPGSGKSTFASHLALCLAAHPLDPKGKWLDRLRGWPKKERDVLPVIVVLRDLATWLPVGVKNGQPQHLLDFISSQLKVQALSSAYEPILEALNEGSALVLFDGLDEIASAEKRDRAREAIQAFAGRFPDCRMVITCRTLSYQDKSDRLDDIPAFELAPFDEKKIEAFIDAWYAELERIGSVKPGKAVDLARRLHDAVRRHDIWRLAPNPLLLSVIALVHAHKGRLPDARAQLYEDTIDMLLWRWEEVKAGADEEQRLRQLLLDAGQSNSDLKRALWRLAFETHGQAAGADAERTADISEHQLWNLLSALHPKKSIDWAREVVEAMKLRAGLLIEKAPGVFTFPHRTFQEHLAGAHLSNLPDFATRSAKLLADGPYWLPAVLLAVGRQVHVVGNTAMPIALAGELCPDKEPFDDTAWRLVWYAGEVLVEVGTNRLRESNLGQEIHDRVWTRLVDILQKAKLPAVERSKAGDALSKLGDPRFREDAWYLPKEPLLGFVEIPEGSFPMGEGGEIHEVKLPKFYLSRYPVTVGQYRVFVEETGHKPVHEGCLRGLENHPVVLVTWYEALKYCGWLEGKLREWDQTPEPLRRLLKEGDEGGKPWRLTLPSEAEWEKAARGGDGRIYPWGDDPDPNRANYNETGIGSTSAVGCFPGGESPYKILDMSGNVWEWTRSLWGRDILKAEFRYPYRASDGREDITASDEILRVLRGGAFDNLHGGVRCADRVGDGPGDRYHGIGFRVVASPFFSGL